MGQEPAELRADIERRRDDLGDTIDAIGDRVSPGRIMERRRNRMVDGVRSLRDRVMGTVADGTSRVQDTAGSVRDQMSADNVKQQTAGSPLGAGLIAFGIGFIVAAAIPPSEPEVKAAHRAQDHLEPAKEALVESGRNVAADMKDEAASSAQDVKAHAADAAGTVADSAKQHAEATKDQASSITR